MRDGPTRQRGERAVALRDQRLAALLQSWKRAHRKMTRRHDPDAEMVAGDIEKLAEAIAQDPSARCQDRHAPRKDTIRGSGRLDPLTGAAATTRFFRLRRVTLDVHPR